MPYLRSSRRSPRPNPLCSGACFPGSCLRRPRFAGQATVFEALAFLTHVRPLSKCAAITIRASIISTGIHQHYCTLLFFFRLQDVLTEQAEPGLLMCQPLPRRARFSSMDTPFERVKHWSARHTNKHCMFRMAHAR